MVAVSLLCTAGILETAGAVFAIGTARSVVPDSIQLLRIADQPHGSREVKDVPGPPPPAGHFDAVSGDQPGGDKGGDGPGRGVFGDPEAMRYVPYTNWGGPALLGVVRAEGQLLKGSPGQRAEAAAPVQAVGSDDQSQGGRFPSLVSVDGAGRRRFLGHGVLRFQIGPSSKGRCPIPPIRRQGVT
jgi:hypothetical protein